MRGRYKSFKEINLTVLGKKKAPVYHRGGVGAWVGRVGQLNLCVEIAIMCCLHVQCQLPGGLLIQSGHILRREKNRPVHYRGKLRNVVIGLWSVSQTAVSISLPDI